MLIADHGRGCGCLGDTWYFDHIHVPVWIAICTVLVIGGLWYYLSKLDGDGICTALAVVGGSVLAFFWPIVLGIAALWGLGLLMSRLKRRIHPILKLPSDDIREAYSTPGEAYSTPEDYAEG